jgi:lipopolysaccharide export LptBFGC system permease protein LptF
MIAILHAYVLRELLKSFALTLLALTVLFTVGGGLYNVLRYEGVNAADLASFIPLLIPVVITLTMPVAALFSAAMVYGRLAADNELNACRAAGINIHRLFSGALLLGVFVAVFSLLFSDLVIPDLVRRIDQYARANLRDLALQRLQTRGYIRYEPHGQKYLLTARSAKVPAQAALAAQSLPTGEGLGYLLVEDPVFIHVDEKDSLVRYATARHGLCQFDARGTPLHITLYVNEGRDFDVRGRTVELAGQQLGPIPVPVPFKRRPSMVDLATLSRWKERPWETDRMVPQVEDFRRNLLRERFSRAALARICAGDPIELVSEAGFCWRISARSAEVDRRGLRLEDVRVERVERGTGRPLFYQAPRAALAVEETSGNQMRLELSLRSTDRLVREHLPRASDYRVGRETSNLKLAERFLMPQEVLDEVAALSDADLLNPATELELSPQLSKQRAALLLEAARQRRKMASVIHFRLGSAVSALVTVLMAAALGVIYRGARALAAFGISCIPFGVVAVLMVMARQLAENEHTQMLGPVLTWGGLAAVGLLDLLIIRQGVRR